MKLKRGDSTQEFFDTSSTSVEGEWKRLDKEAEKIAEQVRVILIVFCFCVLNVFMFTNSRKLTRITNYVSLVLENLTCFQK